MSDSIDKDLTNPNDKFKFKELLLLLPFFVGSFLLIYFNIDDFNLNGILKGEANSAVQYVFLGIFFGSMPLIFLTTIFKNKYINYGLYLLVMSTMALPFLYYIIVVLFLPFTDENLDTDLFILILKDGFIRFLLVILDIFIIYGIYYVIKNIKFDKLEDM